jgi:hypothetical protein
MPQQTIKVMTIKGNLYTLFTFLHKMKILLGDFNVKAKKNYHM